MEQKILDMDLEYSYDKKKPIRNNEDLIKGKEIKTIPMDEEWKETCRQNSWWYKYDSYEDVPDDEKVPTMIKLFELKKRLLSIAGESTCLPIQEVDIDDILSRGQIWYGDKCKMKTGNPCQCHSNSAYYWDKHYKNTRIATGYALTEDGMWRAHTWVIEKGSKSNTVIETTVKRILYFGFVLTKEECEDFANNNY